MDKRLYTRLIEAIDSSQSLETTLNEFSEEIKDIYKRIAVIEVELQLFNNQETLFKASLNPGYQKLPELYKSFSTWDNYISTTSMVDFLGIQKPNKCAADVARGVCAVLRMEYGD